MAQLTEILKVLKVCSSEDLPEKSDRNSNYLYFVYDKMSLYFYRSFYSDPFCIVETMPTSNLVENMLYITITGYVKTYIDYRVLDVGEIEKDSNGNPDAVQLALLVSVGTTYFMNAESRYLDLQTRVLELPYQNGSYQLSVNLASQLKIDKNTTIVFNEDTNQFEISGDIVKPTEMIKIDQYTPRPTNSVNTTVDSKVIYCDIKLSSATNNGLSVFGNGLYMDVSDKVDQSDMNTALSGYIGYKSLIDGYITELRTAVLSTAKAVSETTINALIDAALVNYEPTITEMLTKYDTLAAKMDDIETEVTTETDAKIEAAKNDIREYINQVDTAWVEFSQNISSLIVPYTGSEFQVQSEILTYYRSNVLVLRDIDKYTYKSVYALPTTPDSNTIYIITSSDGTDSLYIGSDTSKVWKTNTYRTFTIVTELPATGDQYTYYIIYNSTANTYTFYEYRTNESNVSAFAKIDSIVLKTYTSTGDESTSYDANNISTTINIYGLTQGEQDVQDSVMKLYESVLSKTRTYMEYTDTMNLPETGNSKYLYFIINTDNATGKKYEVYIWTGSAYELSYYYDGSDVVYYTTGDSTEATA